MRYLKNSMVFLVSVLLTASVMAEGLSTTRPEQVGMSAERLTRITRDHSRLCG